MTETGRRYGTVGALALVAAGVVWAVAVMMQETGEPASALTQGIGWVGLALLAVGMVALVAMMFDVYGEQQ